MFMRRDFLLPQVDSNRGIMLCTNHSMTPWFIAFQIYSQFTAPGWHYESRCYNVQGNPTTNWLLLARPQSWRCQIDWDIWGGCAPNTRSNCHLLTIMGWKIIYVHVNNTRFKRCRVFERWGWNLSNISHQWNKTSNDSAPCVWNNKWDYPSSTAWRRNRCTSYHPWNKEPSYFQSLWTPCSGTASAGLRTGGWWSQTLQHLYWYLRCVQDCIE